MIGLGTDVLVRYQRGTQFAKRAALMADWSAYCAKVQSDAVVKPIRQRKAVAPATRHASS